MIIKVKDLYKRFKAKQKTGSFLRDTFYPKQKEITAVNGISFEVEKGESVALLGPNGAGKTTTMKMLSGLIYPTSGSLSVLGHSPFERNRKFLKSIALVMGNKSGLEWDLTPRQSLDLYKKIYEIPERKFQRKLKDLCDLLDLSDLLDTQVRKLSLGERLKMELSASIIHDPEVLFLDEPTIGLDIISKQKIREFLRQVPKLTDATILLTSHDMADVEKVCDRVIVISKGNIVYDDSIKSLTDQYKSDRYLKFIFKKLPKQKNIEKYAEVVEQGESFYTLRVSSSKMPEVMDKITSKHKLDDIDILSVPLEEIITDLFNKGGV